MTFTEQVYDAVKRIPKGRVATYGQIAEIIGRPGGAQAVGNALHVNPFAPRDRFASPLAPTISDKQMVPCHRVVAADGSLAVNFGCGGAPVQYERLKVEGVSFLSVTSGAQLTIDGFDECPCVGDTGIKSCNKPPRVDLSKCGIVIEKHPLEPFLPANGRILFLGSFPPPKARWSMDFFYPNWINDFWRIQGLIHFGDQHWFESPGAKHFDKARIISFCEDKGLAFFDTAAKICRWKGNASDEFLEILEPADIGAMLAKMPESHTVVTTGGKSGEELLNILSALGAIADMLVVPPVGSYIDLQLADRAIRWWRMPSTSRAYPMPLKDKASQYAKLLTV